MILLGFRYLASSIPLIVFAGVGVGVGLIFSMLLNSMARNPLISNNLVRWAFIGLFINDCCNLCNYWIKLWRDEIISLSTQMLIP